MTLLNIIGDIHGRAIWRKLLRKDAINIFVGDYFSPYDYSIKYKECKKNFNDILSLKKSGEYQIELLIGNHDLDHWYSFEHGCSRHDSLNEKDMRKLFEKNREHLKAAYCNGDVLVTHAGVSVVWMARYTYQTVEQIQQNIYFGMDYRNFDFPEFDSAENVDEVIKRARDINSREINISDGAIVYWENAHWLLFNGTWIKLGLGYTPQQVCDFVNKMWNENPIAFSFYINAMRGDYCGESITHGPMWIRYDGGMDIAGVFRNHPDYLQVYGHTQSRNIEYYSDSTFLSLSKKWDISDTGKTIMVDCLGYNPKSLLVELDDNGKVVKVEENIVKE